MKRGWVFVAGLALFAGVWAGWASRPSVEPRRSFSSREVARPDAADGLSATPAAEVEAGDLPGILPEDAVGALTMARALALAPCDRLAFTSRWLIALAERPEEALRLATALCQQDPHLIREHGGTLVTVLTENRLFDAALRFSENGGAERGVWMTQTFRRWTQLEPETAARAALSCAEPDGFLTVCAVWEKSDPAAFTVFAHAMPEGALKTDTLARAVGAWIAREPERATAWLREQGADGRFAAAATENGASAR